VLPPSWFCLLYGFVLGADGSLSEILSLPLSRTHGRNTAASDTGSYKKAFAHPNTECSAVVVQQRNDKDHCLGIRKPNFQARESRLTTGVFIL
jgi:hypothetical protein